MMRKVIAKSPTHGKWITYICTADGGSCDGNSHFNFEDKTDNAVVIPLSSCRSLAASFRLTYPDAKPLEFYPVIYC